MTATDAELTWEEASRRLDTPEGLADPYPLLRCYPRPGARWQHANALLRDRRLTRAQLPDERAMWWLFNRWLLRLDGDRHRRLKQLMSDPFRRSAVAQHEPAIAAAVDARLEVIAGAGRMEVIEDFAAPLSYAVMWDLLGLPGSDREQVHEGMCALFRSFIGQEDAEAVDAHEPAITDLIAYFREQVEARRRDPGDGLFGDLVRGGTEAGIDADALAANAIFLLHSHHEEIQNFIANGLAALLGHPEQHERLRRDPGLMPTAVEEMLRYEPVVQVSDLVSDEDIEIGGQRLEAGATIWVLFGPVNRDPDVFADPDRFDVARCPNPHLSFATGRHHCLGAELARLELGVIFTALIGRLPGLELTAEPRWMSLIPFRAMERLDVAW